MKRDELTALKVRVSVAPAEARLQTALAGRMLVPCPFHREATGSFGAYMGRGGFPRFKCHGCGWEGDVVAFVAKYDGCTVAEAIAKLAGFQGKPVAMKAKPLPRPFDYYNAAQRLAQCPAALAYLAGRGVYPEKIPAMHLGLVRGYIALPHLLDGRLVRLRLRRLGECKGKERKWYSRAYEPYITRLYGRSYVEETWPFNSAVLITESELDACLVLCLGFPAVSVCNAAHKLTPEDAEWLRSIPRVIVATDKDKAGELCAARLKAEVPVARRLLWSENAKDVGELYVALGVAAFKQRLERVFQT